MDGITKRFQTFEDLDAYKSARDFRKAMYAISRRLPDSEKFDSARQIRRAAVSLTNNIAEGHGRFHVPDQIKFMLQARGSLQELVDDLNVCEDEGYLTPPEVAAFKDDGWRTLQVLNGYLRWLRQSRSAPSHALHEDAAHYGDPDDDLETWILSLPLALSKDLSIER